MRNHCKWAVVYGENPKLPIYVKVQDCEITGMVGAPVEVSVKGYLVSGIKHGLQETIENPFALQPDVMWARAANAKKTMAGLEAEKVVYNPPATIVLWKDGTRTVVKCDEGDTYSPMTGIALCYMKKALGNSSRALNDALWNGKPQAPEKKDEKGKKESADFDQNGAADASAKRYRYMDKKAKKQKEKTKHD